MDNSTNSETWLPIPEWEALYEVSDQGRVRSLGRRPAFGRSYPPKILAPLRHSGGYLQVSLRDRQTVKKRFIHRLVLSTFVGEAGPREECRHLNGDPTDNRLVNLQWGSKAENLRDKTRHGTDHNAKKTHCPRMHPLTGSNVDPVRFAETGWRACLACKRAGAYASRKKILVTQELADYYFLKYQTAAQ